MSLVGEVREPGFHHLTLAVPNVSGYGAETLLDGKPVHGLTRVRVDIGVDEANKAVLSLFVSAVDADVKVGELRWELALHGGPFGPADEPLFGFGATVADALRDLIIAVEKQEPRWQCAATFAHGPGHQSTARCERRDRHEMAGEHHSGAFWRFEWTDGGRVAE